MKKFLLVGTGVGIGYLLGARAGRPAYDRIVATTRQLARDARLDRTRAATRTVVEDARTAGEKLRDKADTRMAETVEKVGTVIPLVTPDADAGHETVTLPDTSRPHASRTGDMADGL